MTGTIWTREKTRSNTERKKNLKYLCHVNNCCEEKKSGPADKFLFKSFPLLQNECHKVTQFTSTLCQGTPVLAKYSSWPDPLARDDIADTGFIR